MQHLFQLGKIYHWHCFSWSRNKPFRNVKQTKNKGKIIKNSRGTWFGFTVHHMNLSFLQRKPCLPVYVSPSSPFKAIVPNCYFVNFLSNRYKIETGRGWSAWPLNKKWSVLETVFWGKTSTKWIKRTKKKYWWVKKSGRKGNKKNYPDSKEYLVWTLNNKFKFSSFSTKDKKIKDKILNKTVFVCH